MPGTVGGRLALAAVLYFGVQVVLRLLIGPSLELDEAEAFFHARELAWGYGAQPPLYFWLQWAVFQILGETLLALAVLKALILSGIVLLLYGVLRREPGDAGAAVAALSLGLLPSVVWESQRALTHSPLAALMAVATAWAAVRALRSGRWRDYGVLGVAVGLGLLSKFNFALWPVGLLLAAVLLPEWRAWLRPLRVLGAVAVALVVVAPVVLWMLENPELATGSVAKMSEEAPGPVAARIGGTLDLLWSVLSFVVLPLLLLGGFVWAARRSPAGRPMDGTARLLGVGALLALAVLWAAMLATGMTEMRERWLLPFAWPLVPAAVLWLWPRLGPGARRGLGGVAGGMWLLAMGLLAVTGIVSPSYRGAEFGPLIARLEELGAGERPLEVQRLWVAGNLVFHAPEFEPRLIRNGAAPEPSAIRVLEDGPGEALAIRRGSRDVGLVIVTPRD